MTAVRPSTENRMDSFTLPNNIDLLSGPEKLVICVDSACLRKEFKKILKKFLDVKCLVNHHEISLAVLNGTDVNFLCDFQSDVRNAIGLMWPGGNSGYYDQSHYLQQKTFDLSKVFRCVHQQASSHQNQSVSLRVIILYGQVDCLPIVESEVPLKNLRKDFPLFTVDFLYMPKFSIKCCESRKQQERQLAQDIFKTFVDISDSRSYVFAVDDSANVAQCVLKFLAHPALRESQKRDWFE